MIDVLSRLAAVLAERYCVEEAIGSGGMATVYRAIDLKHGRLVAIKVLKPEIAATLGTERFLREISLTARLNHPHILPLLDSGEADGLLYYVMPYVPGESVRDRLNREQQLTVDEAVRIVREVGDALAHAHRQGIIHRDIKPENILLDEGHARVADFGISRAIATAGRDPLTSVGLVMGTPAYMSPEQAAGSAVLDGRTDVYALGCVLYELLAGEPPFTGRTDAAVMARHLTQPPPSLAVVRPAVPGNVDAAVTRALAKVPADRFAGAAEFVAALGQSFTGRRRRRSSRAVLLRALFLLVAAGALVWLSLAVGRSGLSRGRGTPTDLNRIAVLYFDDASPDGSLAWLARGLTEDLIDALNATPGLTVISRNGVRSFIGSSASPDSVGRALGVGLLVDGSVEPADSAAGSIRVSVRLVEPASGIQLERLSLVKDRREPLALRRDLTVDVEHLLRRRIGTHVRLRRDRDAATSDIAWEYLRRARLLREDALGLLDAGDSHGAAVRIASADSLLLVAEGAARSWLQPTIDRAELALTRALAAEGVADTVLLGGSLTTHLLEGLGHADRVLQNVPNDPHALAIRGEIRLRLVTFGTLVGRDTLLEAAERDLERATTLDPSLARGLYALSSVLSTRGRLEEARLVGRRALETDVYAEDAQSIIAQLFFAALERGAYLEADSLCAQGQRHYPMNPNFRACELTLLGWNGSGSAAVARAWELQDRLDTASALASFRLQRRIYVAAVLARTPALRDSAQKVLAATLALASTPTETAALALPEAWVRVLLNDRERALAIVQKLAEEGPAVRQRLAAHPWLRPLAADAAFRRMVEP